MKESVRSAWIPFTEPLDTRLQFMYLDVKGLVSTGIGSLIDATARPLSPPTAEERDRSLAMTVLRAGIDDEGQSVVAVAGHLGRVHGTVNHQYHTTVDDCVVCFEAEENRGGSRGHT
jgi:hypothetical protein